MIVKQRITLSTGVMAAIGLGILLLAFFVVVPQEQRGAVAWMDLVVCGFVFLFNFSTLPIVRPAGDNFSHEIPKLGILWTAHLTYSALALACVIRGWIFDLSFRVQFLYQAILLFGVLVAVSIAGKASQHAAAVEAQEKIVGSGLETLRTAAAACETAFAQAGGGWRQEHARFERIRSDIRFLSPCASQSAAGLDWDIATALNDVSLMLRSVRESGMGSQDIRETLDRCQALISLRKQERN